MSLSGSTFVGFSPNGFQTGDGNKENRRATAVLSLVQFTRPPFLGFGTVKLGSSKSALLCIENPNEYSADVKVDRIPSTKGFAVDQTQFTVQPTGDVTLTITWTPVEEGGVRDLVVITVNGIVKHQAILLGKAEAQKKKKKSLWDSIKNKKASDLSAPRKGKGADLSLKRAGNKTFHVSRQSQYKKTRVRGPLEPFNQDPVVSVVSKRVPVLPPSVTVQDDEVLQKSLTPTSLQSPCVKYGKMNQENLFPFNRDSPVVLLVPAATLVDVANSGEKQLKHVPDSEEDPVCGDVTQVLNRTHSPVKPTQYVVNKSIPCIEFCPSPASNLNKQGSDINQAVLPRTPVLSMRDALAVIQSDLTQLESPPNACSSFEFSDSLESLKGSSEIRQFHVNSEAMGPDMLNDTSLEFTPAKQRLTFFVKSRPVSGSRRGNEENDSQAPLVSSKVPFTSVTVIKNKGGKMQETCPETQKTGTSRRCLLGKTVELPEGDWVKPNIDERSDICVLPIIDSAVSCDGNTVNSQSRTVIPEISPIRCVSTDLSVLSPVEAIQSCKSSTHPSSPKVKTKSTVRPLVVQPEGCAVKPAVCTTQSDTGHKKRKSDEFLKENFDDTVFQVKRARAFPATKETKPVVEKRLGSKSSSQRPQAAAAALSSRSSASAKSTVGMSRPKRSKISKPVNRVSQPVKPFGVSSLKTSKVVAVAQSHLTFIKPAQTVIPRHPLPFAAKNMFYDERWMEKQERGFTMWMNYALTPDEFKVNTEVTKVNAMSLAFQSNQPFNISKAPTKEEVSFRTYTARRRLNRLRQAACLLFTSESMVKAIRRLELEVEARRLLVRRDRHLWKDIGQRQKVLNWLLSYNPLWLRIGLETIFGEMIPLESNNDVMGLAMFILRRLLWNPDIAAEFRHPKVPHLYRDGHEDALSSFTLKKLLLLVCFLDKAKESKIIEHDPCLFCMDAEFKTSKDLLLAFSRDFLSGEGILPRHLGYMGLPVSHVQMPLDEFDFAVKNLAVDLRCGIRLVRVMELFTQSWSLSQKLRVPAISRLQKVHNVDIALQVLRDRGVDLKDEHGGAIDSRDIVDGHREKSITLLWKIIFAFQVDVLLDEEKLKEEISFLQRMWRSKQELAAWKQHRNVVPKPQQAKSEESAAKLTLLMHWVNAVCAFYNLKAENFTVSFSDGRLLCYLLHHYHPCHLPLEAISQSTTQTVECDQRGRVGLNCSFSDSDSSLNNGPGTSLDYKELLENERRNFELLHAAVTSLGGIPAMITPTDMSNTIPNEKVVTCYLSFLCARLLDLRAESRAAWVIQGTWRKYRLKMQRRLLKEKNIAAVKIQVAVKRFLLRRREERLQASAIVLQAAWRGHLVRQEIRQQRMEKLRILQDSAAIVIQAEWRRYLAVKRFQRLRHHAVVIQARVRMKVAVTAFRRLRWAVMTFQQRRKASLLAKEHRQRYLSLRNAAITVQKSFRKWKVLSSIRRNNAAVVIQTAFRKWLTQKRTCQAAAALRIQSWYRMLVCCRRYAKVLQNAVIIQAWYRGFKERKIYQILKLQHSRAAIIQRTFKAFALRRRFLEVRHATLIIQRWYRACKQKQRERLQYLKMKVAAVTLQAAYRGYVARKEKRVQHKAAIVIQAAFRMSLTRKRFLLLRRAARDIQRRYRAKLLGEKQKMEYVALRHSAVKLQALWRGRVERRRIERLHKAAALIQSHFRRYSVQLQFRLKRRAALVLQDKFRAYVFGRNVRQQYLKKREAIITLQAGFRGMKVRQEMKEKHRAASLIQATFKAFIYKRNYMLLRRATIVVQQHYRAHLLGQHQRRQYNRLRQAAVKLQASYRRCKVRRDLMHKQRASAVIQAYFRMYKARMSFNAARFAAVIIQRRYRAWMEGRCQREWYLRRKESALVIQSSFRGLKARLKVKEMHKAATVIQACYRRHKRVTQFNKLRWAASVIGQRFKATQLKNAQVRKYEAMKNAAVRIQSAFRGMKTRQQVREMQNAARIIQRHYAAYSMRKRYLQVKAAAVKIQRQYRAHLAARLQQQRYQSLVAASVTIQAAYRGMKVRKELQRMRRSATLIQAYFRMYRKRMPFIAAKLAAVVIQRQYRCHLEGKRVREDFLKLQHSAVVIQAAFRGKRARCEIRRMHSAALVIEGCFRMWQCYTQFQKMRWAARVIQERYRASRMRNLLMQEYRVKKTSANIIQLAFRNYKARQQIKTMHRAATSIQRSFRTFRTRKRFVSLRAAAIVIQLRYKAFMAAKRMRAEYLAKHNAAMTIQAAFRGVKARRQLLRERKAATVIQVAVRRHQARTFHRKLQWAADVVQRRYRANKLMVKEKHNLALKRQAAICIQGAFRGMKARQRFMRVRSAACTLQTAFRARAARKQYLSLKSAVLAMQLQYRAVAAGRRQRELYLHVRSAAVTLQAAYRGWRTRQMIRRQHAAATLIQSLFRGRREAIKYQAMRLSTLIIQQHYRSYLQSKRERERFLQLRNAAISIQAAFRRRRVQKKLARWHRAATLIQATFRMHQQRVVFVRLHWAATVLQRRLRAQKLRDVQLEKYMRMKRAATCLQASFRAVKARRLAKKKRAARAIQSFLQMSVDRRRFLRCRSAAVVIQSAFRGHYIRNQFRKMQTSSLLIQRWYRSCRTTQKLRADYLSIRQAAVMLQSAYRGLLARRTAKCERSAVKIQSVMRMLPYRKSFLHLRSNVVKLQASYRMCMDRRRFLSYRMAAVTLQRRFRARQEMRAQKEVYLKTLKSVQVIQAQLRGHVERKKFLKCKKSAITIQAFYQGMVQRKYFQQQKASATKIQEFYRAYTLGRKDRERYMQMRKSAVLIQAAYRGHQGRQLARRRQAAVKIQAWFKGSLTRRKFSAQRNAAVAIQSAYRGHVQRRDLKLRRAAVLVLQRRFQALQRGKAERDAFRKMKMATLTLQAFGRGWLARRRMKQEAQARRVKCFSAAAYHHLCAIKIQRAVRAHWALESARKQMSSVICIQKWLRTRIQRKRYLEDREKLIKLQRTVRIWLSRRHRASTIIQRAVRKFLTKRREQRVQHGIIKLQALWRGHRSRQLHDTSKVAAMRRRFRKINSMVKEEDKLCNKTSTAIDYLLRYKHFSYILAALKHLETSTRLSPECCEHLVKSGATFVIFTLIRSCNRSVPCMEVISYAIQVLLNLSKYDKTTEAVYGVENSVETLLELLQIYREKAGDKVADKGGSIFTKTCFLLTILLHDRQRASEVRKLPKTIDRISSIYRLTIRKHKKDAERTVMKQRMNASLNGSFFAHTPAHKTKPVPRFAPDWVLGKGNLREIMDPLRAIQMVADAFGIIP
uniref:Assembly factor for spindle microtubules n=1 Tax=Paramormyrops kingsleyae TaxID=1676925 RepID=A0A3B3T4M1_9TELE|nr:abnormal spindle-like microcephaly-associated protein [Paramormyrops kingsleyae]